ncbi:MAG: MGMT family protein, partial [Actinobacteria bacterium]|nr:MGMT family protein [Actinomycetota bacterium]
MLGDLLLVAERDDAADAGEHEAAGGARGGTGFGTDAIIGVYFEGHWYPPEAEAIGERVDPFEDPLLAQAARELREYLAGERRRFEVPVRTHGDAVSEQVWQRLRQIPYGTTTTYGVIATELGNRN